MVSVHLCFRWVLILGVLGFTTAQIFWTKYWVSWMELLVEVMLDIWMHFNTIGWYWSPGIGPGMALATENPERKSMIVTATMFMVSNDFSQFRNFWVSGILSSGQLLFKFFKHFCYTFEKCLKSNCDNDDELPLNVIVIYFQ